MASSQSPASVARPWPRAIVIAVAGTAIVCGVPRRCAPALSATAPASASNSAAATIAKIVHPARRGADNDGASTLDNGIRGNAFATKGGRRDYARVPAAGRYTHPPDPPLS